MNNYEELRNLMKCENCHGEKQVETGFWMDGENCEMEFHVTGFKTCEECDGTGLRDTRPTISNIFGKDFFKLTTNA